jgi:hypothetical protein
MDINPTPRIRRSVHPQQKLIPDRQIQKLILQTPELSDLLRTILRNASSPDEAIEDNSDFEDESDPDEEGNEVINLTRSALISLKKLPRLEKFDEGTAEEGAMEGSVKGAGGFGFVGGD